MSAATVLVGLNESFWEKIGAIFSDYRVHFVRQDYKHFRAIPPADVVGDTSQVEIYVGQPYLISHLLRENQVPRIRWIQTSTSGNEVLFETIDPQSSPQFLLTRFPRSFPEPIAEYVLGMIIATSRHFFSYHDKQKQKEFLPVIADSNKLTTGKRVVILGLGEVGTCVSRLCKAAGMYIVGVKRSSTVSPQQRECVDECRQIRDLEEVLRGSDVIVSALPSTPATRGLLGGGTLSVCQKKPLLINVGRGDVISDEDLLDALSNGWLSQAVLDVFEEEPLPPESPLWTHPDVIVTPHISGRVVQSEAVNQFSDLVSKNLARFKAGEPLEAPISISQGY